MCKPSPSSGRGAARPARRSLLQFRQHHGRCRNPVRAVLSGCRAGHSLLARQAIARRAAAAETEVLRMPTTRLELVTIRV